MKKNKSLFVLLALCFSAIWADAQVSLSFDSFFITSRTTFVFLNNVIFNPFNCLFHKGVFFETSN